MGFRICRGWLLASIVALGTVPPALTYASTLHADQPKLDASRAREVFREALALEAAGDYAGALSKLMQVATFKSTAQVSFNIGVCNEKLGKLVVALGHYRIALADAEQDPALKKVAAEASSAIADLEPKIPSLTIKRGINADDATVTIDGKEVASAAIGSPMMLDPGTHNVEATASGFDPFKKQVKLASGEKSNLDIELTRNSTVKPSPAPSSSAPSTAPTTTSSAPSEDQPTAPQPASSGGSGMKVAGWLAIGIGVAGGITSGIFYAKRSSAISDLNGMCGADKQSCPDSARSKIDDGKSATLIGNIGLGVGVVGLVTGVILLAIPNKGAAAASQPPSAARVRVVPSAPGSWAGITLDTRF